MYQWTLLVCGGYPVSLRRGSAPHPPLSPSQKYWGTVYPTPKVGFSPPPLPLALFHIIPIRIFSFDHRIHLARQLCAGLSYLESLNFVHRDVASRNCLIGPGLSLKLADFGMARALYSNDYYRIQGKFVLPIRWMAWESLLMVRFLGYFGSESGVYIYCSFLLFLRLFTFSAV